MHETAEHILSDSPFDSYIKGCSSETIALSLGIRDLLLEYHIPIAYYYMRVRDDGRYLFDIACTLGVSCDAAFLTQLATSIRTMFDIAGDPCSVDIRYIPRNDSDTGEDAGDRGETGLSRFNRIEIGVHTRIH